MPASHAPGAIATPYERPEGFDPWEHGFPVQGHRPPSTATSAPKGDLRLVNGGEVSPGVLAPAQVSDSRPWNTYYTAVPRDALLIWKEGSRKSLGADREPDDRRSGKGVNGAAAINRSWLLNAHYRLANRENGLEIVRPEVLSAASGISVTRLREEYRNGNEHALSRFVTRLPGEFRNSDGRTIWKFQVRLADPRNSLHAPWWWAWTEPEPSATDTDRVRRRIIPSTEEPWSPSSAALLVCWAIAHVGDDFIRTERHGPAYLATVLGLSKHTVKAGLRDAVRYGMLARTNRDQGGLVCATSELRLLPDARLGEGNPAEHLF